MSASHPTLTLSRRLDRLTTEQLEQPGVVERSGGLPRHGANPGPLGGRPQAPQADNAHHRHALADAETLAWNRAREAEWHAAPAALEALLRELAPVVFNDQPPPLAIGVDVALVALLAGEFEASVITRFLADWTRRPAYLAAVARGDVRRDLDGCPAGAPDDAARTFAAIRLGRRGVAS
jgi:hypothetical protein